MSNEELLNNFYKTNNIEDLTYLLKKTKWKKVPYYYLAKIKECLNNKKLVQDVPNFKTNIANVIIYLSLVLINPSTSILVYTLEMFLASTLGKIIAFLKPDIFMEKGEPGIIKSFKYYYHLHKLDLIIDIKKGMNSLDYKLYKNESEQFNREIYKKEEKENKDTFQNILLIDELNKCLEIDNFNECLVRFKSILENVKNDKENLKQNIVILVQYFVLIIEKYPSSNLIITLNSFDDYFLLFLVQYLCQITDYEDLFVTSIISNNHQSLIKFIEALMQTHLQDKNRENEMQRQKKL